MKPINQPLRASLQGAFILTLCLVAQTVMAQLDVDMTATPLVGKYQYDFSIFNNGGEDVVVVNINDAPDDPLIDATLVAPPGFLADYDSGVLIVSFLGDADLFAVGNTYAGFSFQSLAAPGANFATFDALTINGNSLVGDVNLVSRVPESGNTLLTAGLALLTLVMVLGRNFLETKPQPQKQLLYEILSSNDAVYQGPGIRGTHRPPGALWRSAELGIKSQRRSIKQDPQANITDTYAFIGTKYNDPQQKVLNVLVLGAVPLSDPGDGVIYDRFADDALYSIHIANPNTGETLLRYDFQFSDVNPLTSPGLKNPTPTSRWPRDRGGSDRKHR